MLGLRARSRTGIAVAGTVAAAALAVAIFGSQSAGARTRAGAPGPALTAVSASQLAQGGVSLAGPTAQPPAVTEAEAEQAVAEFLPGTEVRQAVLASVSDASSAPPIDSDCWVISIVPGPDTDSTEPGPGGAPLAASWEVAFVSASSGVVLGDLYGD